MYIYAQARKGVKPEINALSTLMFAVVLAMLLIVNIRTTRQSKGRMRR
jgi:spermidine/putrescine transport system permease protein